MNEINITLEGEEYQIDIQKAKELGVIKEKNTRCRSWEEYKSKYRGSKGYYMNSSSGEIYHPINPLDIGEQLTQQEAIAIQAFSKLLKLRRDWIGDWDPDWTRNIEKYCIVCENNLVDVMQGAYITHPFSFPTREMAKEFLECFKELFEQCKSII